MSPRQRTLFTLLCPLILGILAASPSKLPAPADRRIDFTADIAPIFAARCISCHGPDKQKSDLRLDQKQPALAGGSSGRAIVPGDSASSPLILHVARLTDTPMPPKGTPLTAEQVSVLRAWIDQGANWPETAPATRPTHWSLQPLTKPAAPASTIDAFILAALDARKLSPSPPADRRTLIRRLTFDLTGLPPTPEEVSAFVSDISPAAYEKLVDRLLASPRYGERQARFWMDLVHYAETHGHDEDKPRESAWPYRDYLIRSFNADKPYARFIEEQIAGDVIYPDDPDAFVGAALLAVGPWDQSSMMGIEDETLDKKAARYLDRDDMITTVMSTFLSSTVHCARCHNHKFDPIPQADYYALQAVFAGVDRIDRPYDPDPKVRDARKSLQQRKADIQAGRVDLLAAEVQAEVAQWEKSLGAQKPVHWTVLDPATFTASNGSKLAKQDDGSLLSAGKRPEKDTYTITATTPLKAITAVRLEVLTDPSLPKNGPGRRDNGNLHLSEFKLSINDEPVALQNPTADFDQQDWTILKAIDNNPDTAWGIFPKVGQPHAAVFELRRPFAHAAAQRGGAADPTLTFTLAQLHGAGHLIGRPRLSVTDHAVPVRISSTPDSIASILARPQDKRSEADRLTLARHALADILDRRLGALPPPQLVYTIASDFEPQGNFKPAKKPRAVHLLRRGDIRNPADEARPGALTMMESLPSRFSLPDPADEGARRAALAKWVAHKDNPLTWRSIVNRVWQQHFGRGLVDTPNDFGHMGSKPTHPELLDHLALTFRDDLNGSLKQLHRLIVLSHTYRQSSVTPVGSASADRLRLDPDNRLLWRQNRSRLDAESLRDALLAVSGKLDLTMYGPSARQFTLTKGIHVTPNVHYEAIDVDHPAMYRRGVYRFIFRTVPDPFMQALDCPDASQLTPKRESSVTPLQALAMLNNRLLIRQSQHLAARLEREHPGDPAAQLDRLHQLTLSRAATESELKLLLPYTRKHGLPNACRLILNTNEFMFID